MNAPLLPTDLPSSPGKTEEYFICPICGHLVVAPKSGTPFSPEQIAAVISANPDIVSSSVYAAWDGD